MVRVSKKKEAMETFMLKLPASQKQNIMDVAEKYHLNASQLMRIILKVGVDGL
jgi:hypothetical protein